MALSIESIASSRKQTKELVRVESLIPQQIQPNAENLITLLQDYYSYLNEQGNPSNEIAGIDASRDIDTADYAYLDKIQREIAISIPRNLAEKEQLNPNTGTPYKTLYGIGATEKYKVSVDRVNLYKNLMRYYSIRGSEDSIALFFKIIFDDNVEVYYPKESMLIPSSGSWSKDTEQYTNHKGFLSDTVKLQDSYFYQEFSYVIRTGQNVSTWSDTFNRLVHPAGFIFFGQIQILVENVNHFTTSPGNATTQPDQDIIGLGGQDDERIASSMRYLQPGLIADEDIPYSLIIDPIGGTTNTFKKQYYSTYDPADSASLAPVAAEPDLGTTTYWRMALDVPDTDPDTNMLKFYDGTQMWTHQSVSIIDAENPSSGNANLYAWADYTINDGINSSIIWNDIHLGVTLTT